MANFYTYLIASLPMLNFGMKLPFSFERFLEICRQLIPEKDFQLLSALPQANEYLNERLLRRPIIQKWVEFDLALRNELTKARAVRKHLDSAKYLRPDADNSHSLTLFALSAQRNPSLIEAEKMLDEARWKALEELSVGHYFDFDFLIIYAYKLLLLQRWEKIQGADKTGLLKQVLRN